MVEPGRGQLSQVLFQWQIACNIYKSYKIITIQEILGGREPGDRMDQLLQL